MSIAKSVSPARRRFTLTVGVSVLLVFAVFIPLVITGIAGELTLRPTLLSQAQTEMGNDAQSHAQAIDALLVARMQDVSFLGQYAAIQRYLAGDNAFKQQASDELALGYRLDPNYSAWTLFDTRGKIRLSYPAPPGSRGKYMVAPELLPQLQGINKTRISNVYFDDATHTAIVDIYTSITSPTGTLLGFGRSTLKLSDIWTSVNNETNAATGSYAMILDENGVRIAYTNPDTTLVTLPTALFKPVAPLSPQLQQRISDENLYGNNRTTVTPLADPTLAEQLQNSQTTNFFSLTPALQQNSFQAYSVKCQVVPWTYLVLRPMNTITGPATQQDINLFSIAAVVMLLAAVIGLLVGRGITRPILQSVSSLRKSSQSLNELASREQVTTTEQRWIVETSQTGLQAVQYYAEASSIAARRLNSVGNELVHNVERYTPQQMRHRLEEVLAIANYIENAAIHQERSSQSLSTAIRVTMQVTEQLVSGATSAAEASNQLEGVIEQLRQVVGE
jgi:methyl-accepting chemotaxis protein